MVKGLAFTMYPVIDMQRARRFYEQDLGLKPARDVSGGWVEYDLPGGTFAITTMADGREPSSTASGIGLEVDNVDQMTEGLRQKGRVVKLEPLSTPVCRMSVVLDTEGNAITLHQATQPW
jgi:predicted enzyme related to lactoylglutathione lyase